MPSSSDGVAQSRPTGQSLAYAESGDRPRGRRIALDKEKEAAREASGSLITSGLAGLSAYFLAASLLALREEDALCLLLPGSWCETRYGREIRAWLWAQKHREVRVELFPSRVEVFPGTQVTAMVLAVGPVRDTPQPLRVSRADLSRAGVTIGRTVTCARDQACPATFTEVLRRATRRTANAAPLSEDATIRRGVATGASDFFFLTDERRKAYRLPMRALRRALVKPAHLPSHHLTKEAHEALGREGKPRWLLDLNGTDLGTENGYVAAYLAVGHAQGLHLRHLTSQRPEWYLVEPVRAPDLFIAPVGKEWHRVIVNDVKAVGSNNLYGIYLSKTAPWSAAALAGWLRSADGQGALQDLSRNYQGGSLKIEPRALRGLRVPRLLQSARLHPPERPGTLVRMLREHADHRNPP